MKNSPLDNDSSENEQPVRKDRSLMYMCIVLGVVILIMGYLTLFVDDPWKIFSKEETPETVIDDKNASGLERSETMSDDQVRQSLEKLITAFYYDQSRGYFDPPSYFANLTKTFYNYHNLDFKRLKDVYWRRRANMQNFKRTWIVSSLEFERQDSRIIATYWAQESYYRPSRRENYSADVQYEMVIDEDGKIESLRDIDIRNEVAVFSPPDTIALIDQQIPGSVPVKEESPENKVYDMSVVETVPEFQGGQKEFAKYIADNLKYPAMARQNNVQGKVFLSFIVEKDGSITDIKVKQGIGSSCDEEAVRVMKASPAWKPGMLKGNVVRTFCVLPITFQLQ